MNIAATSTDAAIDATIRAQFPEAPAEVDTAVADLIDRVQSAAYQVNAGKRGDVEITAEHLDITVTITATAEREPFNAALAANTVGLILIIIAAVVAGAVDLAGVGSIIMHGQFTSLGGLFEDHPIAGVLFAIHDLVQLVQGWITPM